MYKNLGLAGVLPLQTRRLVIRPFSHSDRDALYKLQSSPLLTRYAGGTRSRAESLQSLGRIIARTEDSGFGPLAVEERLTRNVIGWCGIQRFEDTPNYEVIYAFDVDHWGKGFATEAATALIRGALHLSEPKIEEIWGVVFPQNLRSIRVLRKLGMQFIENRLDSVTNRYACVYAATRDQFLEATAGSVQSSSKK